MVVPSYQLACCVWEFTLACNLNCIHCGSSAGKKRDDEISTEESLALLDDLKKTGCLGVALMGGEPFLRKDFWEVSLKIRNLGMDLSVITNGTIYSEEIFEKLKILKPRTVAVSIDAAEPSLHDKIRGAKGSFEKSWKFINRAQACKLPVSVLTTVHKLNIGELAKLREMLKGKKIAWQIQITGAEGCRFPEEMLLDEEEFYSVGLFVESTRSNYSVQEMPVIGAHDLGFNSIMLKNTSLYEKWEGCQAGISVLGIRSNGDVLGCLSINNNGFIEGNIRKNSVYEIWNSSESFQDTRNFKKDNAGNNCINCKHLLSCKGGCNEMSLMKTGKLHNDSYCFRSIEQKLFEKEFKNPLKKIRLKLMESNKKILSSANFKNLEEIFLGKK
jgi:radical SAM protein with 4Fe4S-binding SPASM domain